MDILKRKQNFPVMNCLDRVAWILLCVLVADCCIFGGGRVISVGPLGFRMVILLLLLLASLPLMLVQFQELRKNRYLWLIAAFALWLGVCAVIGLVRGNNRGVLISDIKGFCYFAVLLPALCLITTEQRLRTLMKVVVYSSAVLALCHVAVLIVYLMDKLLYHQLFLWGRDLQLAGLGNITDSIPRVFFKSVIYLLGGCGFSLYLYVKEERKPIYPCITGITLFALLISYTRSVYGGVAIAAAVCLLALLVKSDKHQRRQLAAFLGAAVLVFGVLTATFSVIRNANYFGFAIDRSAVTLIKPSGTTEPTDPSNPTDPADPADPTSPSDPSQEEVEKEQADAYLQITQNSDDLRTRTLKASLEDIKRAPVIGNGLGNAVDFRMDFDGGLSEYFYLDMWAKTGIIGVLLYMLPVVYALYSWLRRGTKVYTWIWMGVLLGVMAVSFFNPYMNASLGIILYCCSMAAFSLPGRKTNHK